MFILNKLTMKQLTISVLLAVFLTACGDFGNINSDPNNPDEARTDLLMTQAQKNVGTYIGATQGTLYVQYFSETQYTGASRYSSTNFNFTGWYVGVLQDLQTIIDLNTDDATRNTSSVLSGGSNNNQIAVARILKAYFFQMVTDRWGMVPYSEALKGEANLVPKYDSQSAIYEDLLAELAAAVDRMDGGQGPTGDFIFNGDMEKWRAFANTLRMRVALRISDVNATLAESGFTAARDAGHLAENAIFQFLPNANDENPWFSRYRTRTDYAISKPMADTMKLYDDIRLTVYADPAPDADNGDETVTMDEIVGMPYGLTQEGAGAITNAAISFPGQAIRGQESGLPIFTMAEINLMLAEAVERGWISGNAQDYYEAAIQASWQQWGVYGDGTDYSNYISQPDIAYNSAQWREKIGFQKWIALFPQGYEAWAEWRRLDYPELEPAAVPANESGEIPVRQGYPGTEPELNSENYEAAVSSQGPDKLSTPLWWDMN